MSFDLKRVSSVGGLSRTVAGTIPGVSGLLGDTALGEFLGISTKDVWRLKMKDSPNTEFKGQFVAEELTENVGARLSESTSLNQQNSDNKYLGGDPETITFKTRIWANSSIKNVKASIEQLKSFTKRDPVLKRSPIFTFTSGTEIQFSCFVKSVGGILYDVPRSDGSIRGATFQVTLSKIEDIPTDEAGISLAAMVKTGLGIVSAYQGLTSVIGKINIPGGSLHSKGRKIVVKQGQTFEQIAQLEYGNALVGDILRRAHYNKPLNQVKQALETGDVVDLVVANEIFDIAVTPQSVALHNDNKARQNINSHFEKRSVERTIFV